MNDVQDPSVPAAGTPPQAAPASPPSERDAVVFLAGLGTAEVGDTIDATARRIASAFDDEAPPSAQFMLEEGKDEDYGQSRNAKGSTRRITVVRKAGPESPERPLLDLYSLDYRGTLIGDLPQKTPFKHFLLIFWTMLCILPRLLRAVRSRSKNATEKWQALFGWLVFLILGLYAMVVLLAALGTVLPAITPTPDRARQGDSGVVAVAEKTTTTAADTATETQAGDPEKPPPAQRSPDGVEQRAREKAADLRGRLARSLEPLTLALQYLVVWLTAIGLLFKKDFKAVIQKSGVETVAVSRYLSVGTGSESIADQFSALLNHIAQKEDVAYRNIYVMTYSFGGIAAIDALFPHGEPIGILRSVSRLVTIACPFDFIRTYWPDYFDGRSAGFAADGWLNIYSQADILSSDFQDIADGGASREAGVRLKGDAVLRRPKSILYGRDKPLDEYSLPDRLLLIGFKKHDQYWEAGSAGCYRLVVRALYPEELA